MTITKPTIHIADAHFIEIYGIEWAGFTSEKRKSLKQEKAKQIAEAMALGKEIKDPKGYIEIEQI